MTKTLTYKGITGTVEAYDGEGGGFYGHLLNINGSALYDGDDMAELEEKFRDMVEFYIECELEDGRDPYNPPLEEKPLKVAQG